MNKMLEKREKIEIKINNLLIDFQNKYKCGIYIYDHYIRQIEDRVDHLVSVTLEIKE